MSPEGVFDSSELSCYRRQAESLLFCFWLEHLLLLHGNVEICAGFPHLGLQCLLGLLAIGYTLPQLVDCPFQGIARLDACSDLWSDGVQLRLLLFERFGDRVQCRGVLIYAFLQINDYTRGFFRHSTHVGLQWIRLEARLGQIAALKSLYNAHRHWFEVVRDEVARRRCVH